MTDRYAELQQKLAYRFQSVMLCRQALTHRSFSSDHNERLEFLGDALLDVMIGEFLYRHYPAATEGELSLMRAQAVCGESLAAIGAELGLGELLRLGDGEHKSGGRHRQSSLANAVEALVAAIYLDSRDFEHCGRVVLPLFDTVLHTVSPTRAKDAKTRLQELMQAARAPLPVYELVERSGQDHNALFTVRTSLPSLNLSAQASASNRKKAEQLSAQAVLELLEK